MNEFSFRLCLSKFGSVLILILCFFLPDVEAGFLNLNNLQQDDMVTPQFLDTYIIVQTSGDVLNKSIILKGNLWEEPEIESSTEIFSDSNQSIRPGMIQFIFDIPDQTFTYDFKDTERASIEGKGGFADIFNRLYSTETMQSIELRNHKDSDLAKKTLSSVDNLIEPLTVSELKLLSTISVDTMDIDNRMPSKHTSAPFQQILESISEFYLTMIFLFVLVLVGSYAGFRLKIKKN